MNDVRILGRGAGALTSAWLLAERGFRPILSGPLQSRSRQIALNAQTVALLDDLFGTDIGAHSSARWINSRIVRGWLESPQIVDAPSLSIPAAALATCLEQRLALVFGDRVQWNSELLDSENDHLGIDAVGPGHPMYRSDDGRLSFGRRVATLATLRLDGASDAAVLERTDLGWLFLLPSATDQGTLFVVTASPDHDPNDAVSAAIAGSPIHKLIRAREPAEAWCPIAPTLHHPLTTDRAIRIGEGAFTFDPLCGDGVGYAVRSALLAATVFADLARDEPRGLGYYRIRLVRTFLAHLRACCTCYAGWKSAGWSHEIARMCQGTAFLH